MLTDATAGTPDGVPAAPEIHQILDGGAYDLGDTDFPGAHFHTAAELEAEVRESGLALERVEAVEGPAGLALELVERAGGGWPGTAEDGQQEELLTAALTVARAVGTTFAREMSSHLMAVARA